MQLARAAYNTNLRKIQHVLAHETNHHEFPIRSRFKFEFQTRIFHAHSFSGFMRIHSQAFKMFS